MLSGPRDTNRDTSSYNPMEPLMPVYLALMFREAVLTHPRWQLVYDYFRQLPVLPPWIALHMPLVPSEDLDMPVTEYCVYAIMGMLGLSCPNDSNGVFFFMYHRVSPRVMQFWRDIMNNRHCMVRDNRIYGILPNIPEDQWYYPDIPEDQL